VKTPLKGQRLKDVFSESMTQNSQHIFEFLNAFIAWLNQWNSMKGSIVKLTKETHSALLQTTSELLKMAEYCLEKKVLITFYVEKFKQTN
jgi:hypothetical protein